MQHVGRHSSYATQFWTRSSRPSTTTRDAALLAHSRKSIRRRLVLPLDTHNWSRALEVLHARYARRGRRAADFQCVVRGIASDTEAPPERRAAAARSLDALRDAAFAGEIPSNASLWASLVWANARLRRGRAGLDCLLLADRRCRLAAPTRRHMADALLPLLAEGGMADEAAHVAERFAGAGAEPRRAAEAQRVAGFVAEAAARAGDWSAALASLSRGHGAVEAAAEEPRTIDGLFVPREGPSTPATGAAQSPSSGISTDALRAMMCAMADDGQCSAAMRCLSELRRRSDCGNAAAPLAETELRRLLNSLGAAGRCDEAVELFREHCLVPGAAPMSAMVMNLVFGSFPRATREVARPGGVAAVHIDEMENPRAVVDLFDAILHARDDAKLTDWVLAAVAPALVQLGESERALCLMRHSELLAAHSLKNPGEAVRLLRMRLLALLYAIHATGSEAVRDYALLHFPTAFPREAYRGMPPPEVLKKRVAQRTSARRTDEFDADLRARLAKVRERGHEAFPAGADPEKDPRPIPKGLHDTASGWNFYGRGGEMVFANHKRTAHPLSSHPKVMRALANPYRGWSPRENSVLAHRENVRKWNKRSSV